MQHQTLNYKEKSHFMIYYSIALKFISFPATMFILLPATTRTGVVSANF